MEVFGSSGVRGVANERFTPEFVVRVAKAAGTRWDAERVALARDTRVTGPAFAAAAAAGLASVGSSVEDLGVLPTPSLQVYAEVEGIPGVMVTASHNPPPYNGLKLIGDDGVELGVAALEPIELILREETFQPANWRAVGGVRRVDGARRRYLDGLLKAADRDRMAGADLKVAVDPGHGAGALVSPAFFADLGCSVVTVHAQPDGRFPGREPEPVESNLADLRRLVRAADADLGVAHDGDADRAVFVDERGEHIEGDAALAALAAAELRQGDAVVSAVNASQRLVDVAEDAGARLELTPVGSTHITARVRELQAAGVRVPVAGEGNGGVIFPGYRLTRDGAHTAARLLELVCERPVSEVIAPHAGYHKVRVNVGYETDSEREALLAAAESYARSVEAEVSTIDGFRLDYGDGWVLVRPSGTEPLVRISAEARDPARAEALAARVSEALDTNG